MRVDKISKNSFSAVISLIFFVTYAVSIGYRDPSVGTDTEAYISLYNSYVIRPDLAQSYEFGFIKLMDIVHIISDDPRYLLITVSLLINGLFFLSGMFLFKQYIRIFYSFVLLLSPFYFSLNTNGLRQGIALGICLLSVGIFINIRRNLYIFLIGTLGIIAFHLPMIAAWIGFVVKFKMRITLVIWPISLFVGLFTSIYGAILGNIFGSTKYAVYFNTEISVFRTGLRLDFILFSVLPILFYLIVPKRQSPEYKYMEIFLSAYILINSIGMIINFLPFYSRILLASWILIPFIYIFSILSLDGRSRGAVIRQMVSGYILLTIYALGLISIT